MIQRVCGIPAAIRFYFEELAHLRPDMRKGRVYLFVVFAFIELPKAVILFLELC